MMAYIVKRADTLSRIANQNDISLNQLLSANPKYKANPNAVKVGDRVNIPNSISKTPATKTSKKSAGKKSLKPVGTAVSEFADDDFRVPVGQLTFDVEGQEGEDNPFFSRKLHVPGSASGATIGRGYDMGDRSKGEIVDDLTHSGVSKTKASKFAKCHGLKGKRAKALIEEPEFKALRITPAVQKNLFELVYSELEGDVLRICQKADVEEKYGETNWDTLLQPIKDIVIDLRYRGDYTGSTRQKIQPIIVANSVPRLRKLMNDGEYWKGTKGVPANRFKLRANYLKK